MKAKGISLLAILMSLLVLQGCFDRPSGSQKSTTRLAEADPNVEQIKVFTRANASYFGRYYSPLYWFRQWRKQHGDNVIITEVTTIYDGYGRISSVEIRYVPKPEEPNDASI